MQTVASIRKAITPIVSVDLFSVGRLSDDFKNEIAEGEILIYEQ